MTSPECAWAGEWARCVDYVASDLPPPDAERLEQHLFECGGCAATVEAAATPAAGARAAARSGRVLAVIAPSFVAAIKRQGGRIHEHAIVDGAVDARFEPTDDVLIVALPPIESGMKRVDVEFESGWDGYVQVERGVPVRAGEPLWIACTRHHFAGTAGTLHAKCRIRRADDADRAVVAEVQLTLRPERSSR